MVILIALQKFWLVLKKYWQLIALVVGAVVGLVLLRSKDVSFAEDVKKIVDAHNDEIKKIDDARAEEERQQQENLKRMQDALNAVQQQYDAAKQQLDSKKKQEIEQMVHDYKDDPAALAQKLSDTTGFRIILPS